MSDSHENSSIDDSNKEGNNTYTNVDDDDKYIFQ